MAISMLKIRRPLGRLIFNMGITIPGKTVFLIETAPWFLTAWAHNRRTMHGNFFLCVYHETTCGACNYVQQGKTYNLSIFISGMNSDPQPLCVCVGGGGGGGGVIRVELGAVSIRKTVLPGMVIPMLKIRRPNGRLIFNMEIAIRR